MSAYLSWVNHAVEATIASLNMTNVDNLVTDPRLSVYASLGSSNPSNIDITYGSDQTINFIGLFGIQNIANVDDIDFQGSTSSMGLTDAFNESLDPDTITHLRYFGGTSYVSVMKYWSTAKIVRYIRLRTETSTDDVKFGALWIGNTSGQIQSISLKSLRTGFKDNSEQEENADGSLYWDNRQRMRTQRATLTNILDLNLFGDNLSDKLSLYESIMENGSSSPLVFLPIVAESQTTQEYRNMNALGMYCRYNNRLPTLDQINPDKDGNGRRFKMDADFIEFL